MGTFPESTPPYANGNLDSRDGCCLFESRVSPSQRLFSWDDMSNVMEVWAPDGSSLRCYWNPYAYVR
ncbi:hypothetical protein ARMSODRAFT_957116 [Armillaria solidipes]|uniref:Uncharacterized protein n=1 Tax=Armillaria solidipes TaxID=1076256 RepID=A0A2H3C2G2_9AGAR|nr:hypothetical protein ARMSODRAFT_957116 [Armillaria solidipes]